MFETLGDLIGGKKADRPGLPSWGWLEPTEADYNSATSDRRLGVQRLQSMLRDYESEIAAGRSRAQNLEGLASQAGRSMNSSAGRVGGLAQLQSQLANDSRFYRGLQGQRSKISSGIQQNRNRLNVLQEQLANPTTVDAMAEARRAQLSGNRQRANAAAASSLQRQLAGTGAALNSPAAIAAQIQAAQENALASRQDYYGSRDLARQEQQQNLGTQAGLIGADNQMLAQLSQETGQQLQGRNAQIQALQAALAAEQATGRAYGDVASLNASLAGSQRNRAHLGMQMQNAANEALLQEAVARQNSIEQRRMQQLALQYQAELAKAAEHNAARRRRIGAVGALAGAAIGGYFGGPQGAQVGASAGYAGSGLLE
jgi:hypothetical protein